MGSGRFAVASKGRGVRLLHFGGKTRIKSKRHRSVRRGCVYELEFKFVSVTA